MKIQLPAVNEITVLMDGANPQYRLFILDTKLEKPLSLPGKDRFQVGRYEGAEPDQDGNEDDTSDYSFHDTLSEALLQLAKRVKEAGC